MAHQVIAPGSTQIDTLLGGWEQVTAGYLVDGDSPVLVETGSQSSVPVLLEALADLNVGAADLSAVVVTHIHLDHAGGVGDVARAFPNATVYVHEKGARHLADPSRLVDSAARVYGQLLDDLYGRLDPTPADRIVVLDDGDAVGLSATRSLTAVDSPGHAKHHLALHDSDTGMLFVGDAVGVRLPDAGVLRPSTPPPDFDLDAWRASLDTIQAWDPQALAITHFGDYADVAEHLDRLREALARWTELARDTDRDGYAAALRRELAARLSERDAASFAQAMPPEDQWLGIDRYLSHLRAPGATG